MVYHVLRDGTVKTDITGHVVKVEDAEPVYRLLTSIVTKDKESRKRGKKCV